MKKNSDFKNISYTNYEFISIFIILVSCGLISNIPKQILTNCCSASIIGTSVLCIVSYFIYKFINKKIFNYEYDFIEIIKKTYSKPMQSLIAIIIYLFCIFYIYILICNISYNLKTTTYIHSTIFELAIYFIVAAFLVTRNGFNSIFRIAGYVAGAFVIYIFLLFILSLPFLDISHFLPILGSGFKGVFLVNLQNLSIFAPLFFTLLFGGQVHNYTRNNSKNLNKIMLFCSMLLLVVIIMFIGAMPSQLLSTRSILLFDISRIVSFSTTSIKIAPIMIFTFSFLMFLGISFVLLIGCMVLERLKVIKEYTKVILSSIILITTLLLLPQSLFNFYNIEKQFQICCIIIGFIFPIVTILIYSIKNHNQLQAFNLKNNKKHIKVTKTGNITNTNNIKAGVSEYD
ncbi:MAG: hypothetical protein RSE00_02365 [Clostridia bacterium]